MYKFNVELKFFRYSPFEYPKYTLSDAISEGIEEKYLHQIGNTVIFESEDFNTFEKLEDNARYYLYNYCSKAFITAYDADFYVLIIKPFVIIYQDNQIINEFYHHYDYVNMKKLREEGF